jgi:hypothetical protein
MKPFYKRGILLAIALTALGREAAAQSSPYGSPSILPLPETRSVAPTDNQAVTPASFGGYRQAMATNQESVGTPPPALDANSDVPASTAESLGTGAGGDKPWWKPWGNSTASGSGGCGQGGCCMSCTPYGGAKWFGSVGGLFMTRNTPNPFWTTYNTANVQDQLLNTKQAGNGNWGGGGQVTFGRWWCPCPCGSGCGPSYAYGLQFTYWQLADINSTVSANSNSFGLGTPIDMTTGVTQTLNGNTIDHYFDGTDHQKISRTDRFLNIEINGLVQPIYNNPGRCSVTLLAGIRYFRFQDILTYGSAAGAFNFGDAGGTQEAYLQSNVTNNLYGGQIGTLLNFAVTPTIGLFVLPKAGLFGNQINITNSLYGGNGATAFNYHTSQCVCSLMGELDSGAYWWMTPNCQLFFGWRVIGVSNVALADNQFLPYIADSAGFRSVKSNGDLILTGGFGGVAWTF